MSGDPFLDVLDAQAGAQAVPPAGQPTALSPVASRIAQVEGTGQNPSSSARGLGQFTDSTLIGTFRRHNPNSQLSDQQIIALKDDPQAMTPLLNQLVQDNSQALSKGGIEPSAPNIYLAHYFGASGAQSILKAPPNMPIEQVVGQQVVQANPNLRGATVSQVIGMVSGKMGDAPTGEAQPAPTAAHDPYLALLDGVTKGGASGQPNGTGPAGGNPVRGDISGGGGALDLQNGGGAAAPSESWWETARRLGGDVLSAGSPIADSAVNGRSYSDAIRDRTAGFASGVAQVPASALHLAGYLSGFAGSKDAADALHRSGDSTGGYFNSLAADPNSASFQLNKFGGEVAATAPVAELTPFAAAARSVEAGRFVTGLARYGDLAVQGAVAGAAASGGKDMGKSALYGAALGPVVGVAADRLLPPAMKVAGAVSEKAKNLAQILTKTSTSPVEQAAVQTAHGLQQMFDAGASKADLEDAAKRGGLILGDNIDDAIAWRATGKKGAQIVHTIPAAPTPPKSATPDEMRQALGSRGSNSGLEANPNLPANVAAHVDQLRAQGVPLDHAIREAEITAVGGNPNIANVTRNPEDQAAIWEGAKEATPEGRALSAQIAQNNAAVVNRVQNMVQDYGGVPAQGEAAETAAQSLAKASDAAKQQVTDLYTKAAAKGGEATVDAKPLNDVFQTPEAKAPVTSEGRSFVTGMRRQVAALSDNGAKSLTAADLERLRQTANDAYDPTAAKEVNRLVGQVKDAIDQRFDEIGQASDAYKAARAAHKQWASTYEAPAGISQLIRRDAQGNFVNGDNWRKAENFIGSTADKPFVQVVQQLKTNGDTQAISRLKASVLQWAYERGTNNATDKAGNATLNGKMFFAELNKIGAAKLKALFSPSELAEIASTGRAAIHLNEAVPGTNNTSHTASALAKVLMKPTGIGGKTRVALKVGAHVGSAVTGHVVGNLATEGADRAISAISKRAQAKELARALTESMDPSHARAVHAANAKRLSAALDRRNSTRMVTNHIAPLIGALQGHR